MPRLEIEPTIKVGDLLTSISILITLVSLLIAWSHETQVREREQADKVRHAAALTLAKLERLQELTLWYYDEIQPLFVQTSESLAENRDIVKARDALWRQLDEARIKAVNRVHEEQIEQAYTELYGYYPHAYEVLTQAIAKLKSRDESLFKDFQGQTESDVFSLRDGDSMRLKPDYQSAELGNALRATAQSFKDRLKTETDQLLKEPHDFVLRIVIASDEEILRRTGTPRAAASPTASARARVRRDAVLRNQCASRKHRFFHLGTSAVKLSL